MDELTIGEVARYSGLQTSAIRYYERMGLLPPPKRVNGHRRYDPSVLKRLGLIQLVRQAGFGIRELQILFSSLDSDAEASTQWKTLAAEKITEMDTLIKRTQATKAWLVEALERECKGVDECVTITFNESVPNVVFTCDSSTSKSASKRRKSVNLMTMPLS